MATIFAPQTDAVEPELFQSSLIAGMTQALHRTPAPPCLLRAPTGSGKTFVISKVLENVCREHGTLWLWFVPFVNLVQQTEDALAASCPGLSPVMLSQGRNQQAESGQVWISTAAAVARAKDRKTGYNADADDDQNTLAETLARARARGLRVGLVVDEAHIGLDKTTEFGQFAQWVKADYLVLATATPNDQRLLAFLAEAGFSGFESFAASRADVVDARLNKRFIEAVVYDLRQSMQGLADLKLLVLRQAWRRHLELKKQLVASGVNLVPLLLVQVGNGEKTVEEAEQALLKLCRVPPAAIGKHSADSPDPVLMAAIAHDQTKEVLIFKQSAGTGFDAPRAFVLASTKPVNDPDFAMQFMGRVMRVARPVRNTFAKPKSIPAELNTAYVYLADAEAQQGFEQAVQRNARVQTQLEGQTEKLYVRQMQSGACVYTNRETVQPMLDNMLPLHVADTPVTPVAMTKPSLLGDQGALFGFDAIDPPLDTMVLPSVPVAASTPQTRADHLAALATKGIHAYTLREALENLPAALKRESRPMLDDMSEVSKSAAMRLPLSPDLIKSSVRVALNRLTEKEVHTELTGGQRREQDVAVITDRSALARAARQALLSIPHCEEEDADVIVQVLAQRLQSAIDEAWEALEEDQRPDALTRQRQARDAAHWAVHKQQTQLFEVMQALIATECRLDDAAPLPHAMLFPGEVALSRSAKNIYGVLPPNENEWVQAEAALFSEHASLMRERTLTCTDGELRLSPYDGGSKLNEDERQFSKALDRAEFVSWWHRNPDRKGYGVRLVRSDSRNYFWPDFVVCLKHLPSDRALQRLVETKHDTKDAAHKASRTPLHYGKVLFLTRDKSLLRIVNEDGSLGDPIDEDDLVRLRDWMRDSAPTEGIAS